RPYGAGRQHKARRVSRLSGPPPAHEPTARARPVLDRSRSRRSGPPQAGRCRCSGSGAPGAARVVRAGLPGRRWKPGELPRLHPALARGVQRGQAVLHGLPERVGQRPHRVLPRERKAGRRSGHGRKLVSAGRRGAAPLYLARGSRGRARADQRRLPAPLPHGARNRRDAFRRAPGLGERVERRARPQPCCAAGDLMSITVCLAPANTVAYPKGGGHLWVYLHWALGLKALGCRVIWLEGIDVNESDTSPAGRRRRRGGPAAACVAELKAHLAPYGLADALALYAIDGQPVPVDIAQGAMDLTAAAEADLLLNLW